MTLHRGDPAAARAFFTQALTHHSLAMITHVDLAQAVFQQSEIASAVAQYTAALASEPAFFAAHHGLALLYESTGDTIRAEQRWEPAYAKGASWTLPYAGTSPPVRVPFVVSGRGGDIVAHRFLDERSMETALLLADGFADGALSSPNSMKSPSATCSGAREHDRIWTARACRRTRDGRSCPCVRRQDVTPELRN